VHEEAFEELAHMIGSWNTEMITSFGAFLLVKRVYPAARLKR
jgi:hypothetical protein